VPLSPGAALDRAWIESHIPHQGRMCLIDQVLAWDPEHIRCASNGHRSADHPLRAHGRLGIACGVEIAAQVMAVHAALLAQHGAARPAAGLLASVRDLCMHVARLDDVPAALICDAVRMAADAGVAVYRFELRAQTQRLLGGRATVVLDAGKVPA